MIVSERGLVQVSDAGEIGGAIDRVLANAQPQAPPELQRRVAASIRRRFPDSTRVENLRQRVEQVLTVLGAQDYENDVVVDRNARAQRSEDPDLARLEEAAADDRLGDPGAATSDTADHLRDDVRGDQYGTRDVQKAIERGQAYEPPDGPVQEGAGDVERH